MKYATARHHSYEGNNPEFKKCSAGHGPCQLRSRTKWNCTAMRILGIFAITLLIIGLHGEVLLAHSGHETVSHGHVYHDTSTRITSTSISQSVAGVSTTLTIGVSVTYPNGGPTQNAVFVGPGGGVVSWYGDNAYVYIYDGTQYLGRVQCNASGQGTFTYNGRFSPGGSHTITARFFGYYHFYYFSPLEEHHLNSSSDSTTLNFSSGSAPSLQPIPNLVVNEKQLLVYQTSMTDPDAGQTHSYSLIGAPANVTITPSGVLYWTPTEYQGTGQYTFKIRVTDSAGLSDEETVNVTVNEVNDAPSFTKGGDQTVAEDAGPQTVPGWATNMSYGPAGEPIQALDFIVTNDNNGLFSAQPAISSNGTLTYTPAANAHGSALVTVKIHDDGGTANGGINTSPPQTFVITVTPVNDEPVVTPVGNKSVDEETLLTFTVAAQDVDSSTSTITYSLEDAPSGASINASTGVFTWTPTEEQGPLGYTFTIRATDDGNPAASGFDIITVQVNEVNKAPELGSVGDKTVALGATLSFTAAATDADIIAGVAASANKNKLTYSLGGAPAGAAIDPDTGAFTWAPVAPIAPGEYIFAVRVTDDGSPNLSDEERIKVIVTGGGGTSTGGTTTGGTTTDGTTTGGTTTGGTTGGTTTGGTTGGTTTGGTTTGGTTTGGTTTGGTTTGGTTTGGTTTGGTTTGGTTTGGTTTGGTTTGGTTTGGGTTGGGTGGPVRTPHPGVGVKILKEAERMYSAGQTGRE